MEHSVNLLCTMAAQGEYSKETRKRFQNLLETHPATVEFYVEDLRTLQNALERNGDEELRETYYIILAAQLDEWLTLGRPTTHEEWIAWEKDGGI